MIGGIGMRTCTNAEITKEQIENLLTSALDQLYKNDGYLVDNRPYLKEKTEITMSESAQLSSG